MKKGPNKKVMLSTAPHILERLGAFIHDSRLASGFSRKRICAALDISNSQLSTWEKGRAEPRFCYLIRFCSLLGIGFDKILEIYGTGMVSTDTGNLIAKYSGLHAESQSHVKSIIDALFIADSMGKTDKNTTHTAYTQFDSHKEPSAIDKTTDNSEKAETNTAPVKPEQERPGKKKFVETAPIPVVKRGRGRPRKVEPVETAPAPVVKRGRGRPRKVEPVETAPVPIVKRGRGRPRKVPAL